jgi:hypothetical protein
VAIIHPTSGSLFFFFRCCLCDYAFLPFFWMRTVCQKCRWKVLPRKNISPGAGRIYYKFFFPEKFLFHIYIYIVCVVSVLRIHTIYIYIYFSITCMMIIKNMITMSSVEADIFGSIGIYIFYICGVAIIF